jgi:hypothetical protein
MTRLIARSLLLLSALVIPYAVYSQGGGGGDSSGSQSGSIQAETSLAGTWTMEFELEFDSVRPEAADGSRVSVRADVTVVGANISGRFRRPATGEFDCTVIEGSDRCERGRILIAWPGQTRQDVGTFEFLLDPSDGRRAKGESQFTDSRDGAVRLYSVNMNKR